MGYWKQFEEFNPLTGKVPFGPFFILNNVASRARVLLKGRSLEKIISIALSIDWLIYAQLEKEYVDVVHPEDESTAALADFINDAENTGIDSERFDLFESSTDEQEENKFDGELALFIDEVGGLKDFIDRYFLEDVEGYEMFAVLALWKISDCLRWAEYKPASPALNELLQDSSSATLHASKALESLCHAECLHAIQPFELKLLEYEEQLDQKNGEILKQIELKVSEQRSAAARGAAYKRNEENIMLRQDAIAYYEQNKDLYKSTEEAARNIAGKIVLAAHRTVVKWISEHKKLHSAR